MKHKKKLYLRKLLVVDSPPPFPNYHKISSSLTFRYWLTRKFWTHSIYLALSGYLIHEGGDGFYQLTVFLSQEPVPSLLLLQSLSMAPPEELYIFASILNRHIFYSSRYFTFTNSCMHSAVVPTRVRRDEIQTWLLPLHNCLSIAAVLFRTSIS